MWRISAELVTIVSSYGRGGKNYFHLMSWQPDVFHLCFFLAPMQHFATLSSASAFTCSTNGEPRNVINQTSQSLPPFALLAVSKTLMTDTLAWLSALFARHSS